MATYVLGGPSAGKPFEEFLGAHELDALEDVRNKPPEADSKVV